MNFDGFNVIEFGTSREGVVYVFFAVTASGEIPFYVGETDRFQGRMDDYVRAQFAAPTDFKVGEAIKYLRESKKCSIVVKYRPSADRCAEETSIIKKLRAEGKRLLNDVPGYKYRTKSKEDRAAKVFQERQSVRHFCDELMPSK